MNRLSRRPLLLLLVYVFAAILLTLLIIRNQSRVSPPEPRKHEASSHSPDKLGPHEWFYVDRNYPDWDASPFFFRERLEQAIAFDKVSQKNIRGLDHPWTIQGPGNLGGRVNTIAVHPEDGNFILLGFSQGGIYRTTDGGQNWNPVFDDQPSLSIAHIHIDPHQPDRVWAATGDVNISGYPFVGAGAFLSEDGGETWQSMGLEDKGVLSKVVVDPHDPQIIYVGSMGIPALKGDEKGLFRSIDGGVNWQKSLTIDDSTGVIDLVADPVRPGHVYASGWTRIRTNVKGTTVGPGTGLYKSEDYGASWINLTNGLPDSLHSRTGLEITNNGTLFISYVGDIYEGECAGYKESLRHVFRSTNAGGLWESIPVGFFNGLYCEALGEFGWYFEALKVNPENPDDLFVLGVDLYRSVDGGQFWFEAAPPWWTYEVHADKHDLVFAHGRMYLGTDGGAYQSDPFIPDLWIDIENIPSTQFYRTTWNPHIPDQYYGGAQDNGTSGGNVTFINQWPRMLGGDGFQPLFDPTEPHWMYALIQNGVVYFSDEAGFDFGGLNKGLEGARYWDMPLVMSSHDPKILFCGSYKMFTIDMRDTARAWREISPDLTKGDTILGGRYPAITAIAQSPLDSLRLYAGTQDGLLWTTADGGQQWTNITEGTPGNFVTSITCSTVFPESVFVTYSGYRDNDHEPYIYRSDDAGGHWETIATDLPMMGVNNLLLLPGWEDAVMFAATDGGVYVSLDGGVEWARLGSGFPYMPVYDLDYNPELNELVAATFSRGLMTFPVDELDLISSSQDMASNDNRSKARLYPTVCKDHVFLSFSEMILQESTHHIAVFSLTGGQVRSKTEFLNDHYKIVLLDDVVSGLYFVNVQIGTNMTSLPFLIQ